MFLQNFHYVYRTRNTFYLYYEYKQTDTFSKVRKRAMVIGLHRLVYKKMCNNAKQGQMRCLQNTVQ